MKLPVIIILYTWISLSLFIVFSIIRPMLEIFESYSQSGQFITTVYSHFNYFEVMATLVIIVSLAKSSKLIKLVSIPLILIGIYLAFSLSPELQETFSAWQLNMTNAGETDILDKQLDVLHNRYKSLEATKIVLLLINILTYHWEYKYGVMARK